MTLLFLLHQREDVTDEEDSDEEANGGKGDNKVVNKVLVIQDIDNAPHKSGLRLEQANLAQQLLNSGNNTVQINLQDVRPSRNTYTL